MPDLLDTLKTADVVEKLCREYDFETGEFLPEWYFDGDGELEAWLDQAFDLDGDL